MVKLQSPNHTKLGQNRDSNILKLFKGGDNKLEDSMEFGGSLNDFNSAGLSSSTEKWNPLTFAIFNGNLELVRYIISKCHGNSKQLVKLPGLFKTQEISRLYPFIMALNSNNIEMFKFFWEEMAYVFCTEDTFESMFRLLARKEKPELVTYLLKSESTMTLFLSMSYSYRLEFINHIL